MPVVSTVTWTMQRHVGAGRGHRPPGADDGGLGLQQVLRGLDQHRVDAAGDQAARPASGRRRAASAYGDVPEGRQLGARARPSRAPSAAGPASTSRRRPRGRCRAPASASSLDPVRDVVLAEVGRGWRRRCWSRRSRRRPRSRRRGRARTTSGRVTLRISLQPSWPWKSSSVEVLRLQHRAHRPVGDDDASGERGAQQLGALDIAGRSTRPTHAGPRAAGCTVSHVTRREHAGALPSGRATGGCG